MAMYVGSRGLNGLARVTLVASGKSIPINPRTDLKLLSDGGLDWTEEGQRSQLALALLAGGVTDDDAEAYYLQFEHDIVRNLPYKGWKLSVKSVWEWYCNMRTLEDCYAVGEMEEDERSLELLVNLRDFAEQDWNLAG